MTAASSGARSRKRTPIPGELSVRCSDEFSRIHRTSVSHSIDYHASQVAWNDEMRTIPPGEELIYEFTADYAGVWMYHCGTEPVLHHISNGMFGMVIVEPEGGLPPMENASPSPPNTKCA